MSFIDYSETPGNEGCFERNGKTDRSKYLFLLVKLMRNNHKLFLFFCFFKSGLSGTRFVQLLSIKHGSGFVN